MAWTSCGRVFLLIVNKFFLLLGLALLAIGVIFKVRPDFILDSNIFLNTITPILKEVVISQTGNLLDYLESLNYFVIVLGAVIAALGFLGCCGACCNSECLLTIYAIAVSVILLAQVTLVVLFAVMKSQFEDELLKAMKDQMRSYKHDLQDKRDDTSNAYNALFETIDCCGINGYQDLHESEWYHGQRQFPSSCCVNPSDSQADCEREGGNYKDRGCYDVIKEVILKNSDISIGVGVGLIAIELLCVISAIALCRHASKQGME